MLAAHAIASVRMSHRFGQDLIANLEAGHGMTDHAVTGQVDGRNYDGASIATCPGAAWTLQLDGVRGVRFIVIENAPPPLARPDLPIEVALTAAGEDWQVEQTGHCSFGDATDGLPMVIDLGPGRRLSALRLVGQAGLTLGRVRLIGPERPRPDFRFVATRLDGLCQRLTTLLNAIMLAELTERDFGFVWYDADLPEIDRQANANLGLVFRPDFVDRHLVDYRSLKPGMPHYLNRPYSEAEFDWLMAAAEDHGVFQVDRPGKLERIFPHLADRIDPKANARAFDGLGFTDSARAAIEAGRAVDIPRGAVGLHLRGGDIVHGTHSNHGGYLHKAVSIFEAEAIAERTRDNGKPLVIVGQELDFIDAMTARHDHVSGVHHHAAGQGFDPVQGVLFDVVVLSRMARIWAPNSAVSRLAMKIGNVRLSDIDKARLLPPPAILRDGPLDHPAYAAVSAEFKAYSAIKTVWMQPVKNWGAMHLAAVHRADSLRPGVQFIQLLLAAIEARMGRMDVAEERARDVLTLPPVFEEADVTSGYLLSTDPPAPTDLIATLAPADAERHPHAHLLYAMAIAFHAGDNTARDHVRRVLEGHTGITLRPRLARELDRLILGKRDAAPRPEDEISWLR